MTKQFTVKSNGKTAEGKNNWQVFDKLSETFLPQFEGGRFALQDIAKQLNEGTITLEKSEESINKTVGYMRISTKGANQAFDRQETQLEAYGVNKIYKDKITGAVRSRPELDQMLDELEVGDTVVILSIDRLSRSTKDLLEIVELIKEKGAYLKSINDSWLDTTESSPMADFLLTVMGALGQMEKAMINQRVAEGMEIARAKGTKFGRPKKNKTKVDHALELYKEGKHTVAEIQDITGVSRATLYRRINEKIETTKK